MVSARNIFLISIIYDKNKKYKLNIIYIVERIDLDGLGMMMMMMMMNIIYLVYCVFILTFSCLNLVNIFISRNVR